MARKVLGCAILALIFACSAASAQDVASLVGTIVRVETSGGGTFQGELLAVAEDRIEVLDADGLILQVARTAIKSVVEVKPERGGNLYFQDASSNRLILIPTGFGMEPNELHIADQEIIGVTASWGVSEHFSAWAGVSIPGFLVNARGSFTLANDYIGVSVGSFAGVAWMDMGPGVGRGLVIPYLIASFGSENRNITAGGGAAVSFANPSPSSFFGYMASVVALGGKLPLSSTTAIITENWVIFPYHPAPGGDVMVMLAIPAVVFRIAGNRLSWDIGAAFPFQWFSSAGLMAFPGFPIPILALTYRIK